MCSYDFGAGDYPGLCSYLNNKLSEITRVENVEEIWTITKDAVLGGVQRFIPKHKRKTCSLPVWCNGVVKHQINCLRTLRRKMLASKFSLQRLMRLQQVEDKDKLQQDIIKARVCYESKFMTGLAANNNYTTYRYITE